MGRTENGRHHHPAATTGFPGESLRTRYNTPPYEVSIESRQPGSITLHVEPGVAKPDTERTAAQIAAVEDVPTTFTHSGKKYTTKPDAARELLTLDNIYERIASHGNELKGLDQSIVMARKKIASHGNELKGLGQSIKRVQRKNAVERYVGRALYGDRFLEEKPPDQKSEIRLIEDVTREEIAEAIGGIVDGDWIRHPSDMHIIHYQLPLSDGSYDELPPGHGIGPTISGEVRGTRYLQTTAAILKKDSITFVESRFGKGDETYSGVMIDNGGNTIRFEINETHPMFTTAIALAAELASERERALYKIDIEKMDSEKNGR